MKNTKFLISAIMGILLATLSAFAVNIQENRPVETYETVKEGRQKLLLFKSKTIRELVKVRHDSQLSDAEKIQLIKSKFFVDAVSIGDGKSYCDQASVLYQDRKYSKEAISKQCNSLIASHDFIDPIVLDPFDIYDLREINKTVAAYLNLLIFFSL